MGSGTEAHDPSAPDCGGTSPRAKRAGRSGEREIASFPIFLKEELGGPNAAERARMTAAYERRQERNREAAERRFRRVMNAGKCAICGGPVEEWNLRRPRNLSTCGGCERPVQAKHYPSLGSSGWAGHDHGGPAPATTGVLRACLVAIWHLDHPDRRPRTS